MPGSRIFFKIRERNAKRLSRQSEEKKLEERNLSLISKQNARQCNQYRLKEALQNRNRRILHEFRVKENEQERQPKWKARLDKWYLEKERLAKQASRLKSRNGNVGSILDCKQKAINRREFSTNEQVLSKRRKYGSDISPCIQMFHKSLSDGPVYCCSCCHQTWFRQSASEVNSLSDTQKYKYLTKILSVDNKEWICTTCKRNVQSDKTPKLSVLNRMVWPPLPKELELHPLEERLIAQRIPFMQIR